MPRVAYGNAFSRDGWPMVNRDECDDNPIPGTDIRIPLQRGIPNRIMKAFAADFHAFVEPLTNVRGIDEGGWTPTNDVKTSNHLSGTAMDLNWNQHPFRVSYAGFDQREIDTTRELLAWYENTMFWGQDWEVPRDPMHFEMQTGTFKEQIRCEDFIRRKIRADGFSSFRRGGTAIPLPPSVGARFYPLGAGRQVTSPFGPRSGGFHTGVDFGRAGGSADMPVFAAQGGSVIMAGAAQGYGGPDPAGWLVIDHTHADGSGCTEYGHIVREVVLGQRVAAGQRIAHINPDQGTNGGVSPHLHFAVMPQEYNPSKKMDPIPWLAGAREPGAVQIPLPPPAPNEAAIDLLLRAMGGSVHRERYRQLLPKVSEALNRCQCTNVERLAMWMAQIGHESGGLKYQEEIASGAAYEGRSDLGNTQAGDGVRYKGRDFIQITGRNNYGQLSKWAHEQGITPTPTFFVDHPNELATDRYAFAGVTWYWMVARPKINSMCDRNDLEGVTRAINGGLNGLQDRRTRWDRARTMGNALFIIKDAGSALESAPVGEDDFLSALTPDEQRRFITDFYAFRDHVMRQRGSTSPLRHLGEGTIGAALDIACFADGNVHVDVVKELAEIGHTPSLALLVEVANADPVKYPDRQEDALLARAILGELPAWVKAKLSGKPAPAPMPTPVSMPPPAQNGPLAIEPARIPPPEPAPTYVPVSVPEPVLQNYVPPVADVPGKHAADEVQGELVGSTSGVADQLDRLTEEAHTFVNALTVAGNSLSKLSK